MKTGQIYKQFTAKNGKLVTLRSIRWEDLDRVLWSAEELFQEWETDPNFGVPMSKKQTLETEARWLANNLVKIETGKQISVVAEVDGNFVGNCEVNRSENIVMEHYGRLGIAVSKEFRNIGLGYEIMKTALDECRKSGITLIDLEVFASNEGAIHLYEKVGFRKAGRTPNKINRNGQFEDDILMVIQL